MSGGWVTMPLNGWTMLAQEEVRAMTTTTGTDLAPRLRAFKHRLLGHEGSHPVGGNGAGLILGAALRFKRTVAGTKEPELTAEENRK